jgi:hypothetical protein
MIEPLTYDDLRADAVRQVTKLMAAVGVEGGERHRGLRTANNHAAPGATAAGD